MKKTKKYIIFFMFSIFLFLFFSNAKAANTMKYINANKGSDYYFVLDKDDYNEYDYTYIDYEYIEGGYHRQYNIRDFSIPDISETYHGINTLWYSDFNNYLMQKGEDSWLSTIYVCSVFHQDLTPLFSTGYIYMFDNYSKVYEENTYYFWEIITGGDSIHCYPYVPEENLSPEQLIHQCESYDNILYEISEIFIDYPNSTHEQKTIKLNQYNTYLNQIKTLCGDVLERTYYNDPCLRRCLYDLENDIKAIDDSLEIIQGYGPCGFSQKLILFIANIVKWGKYLIPVIVIIFGILDFIKALSSEKEDEMKKAQGHFIKRLIICALIFIIPFIVEFVLDKMGFAANGCGIIDL